MQIIEDIFSEEEQLFPSWVLNEHTRPPTFRDGSKLLQHRKGVLASKHLFGSLERVTGVDTYPRIDIPQRSDLRLFSHGEQAGPTVWIYENRKNMVRFWNHLIDNGLIDLDGDRLRRSREGVPNYSSHDVVWTIPGVGGDLVDAFELFKDNHITFRS